MALLMLATLSVGCADDGDSDSGPDLSAQRTQDFLTAFEQRDADVISALVAPNATFALKLTLDGSQTPLKLTGQAQILGYMRNNFERFGDIHFRNVQIRATDDGGTTFAEADGDFTTAGGEPYRNVYLFRLDWAEGQVVNGEEYANPITFLNAFGPPNQ